jgi:SWI/SNF-related matrix-associated actin-dependent regulator of chromatin subfamily A3
MAASSSRGVAAAAADDDDEPYLLGFIISNIYATTAAPAARPLAWSASRETVGLVHQPLNRYDNNAIAVFNARNNQVGHLPGALAAVLAPLLDFRLLAPTPPPGA